MRTARGSLVRGVTSSGDSAAGQRLTRLERQQESSQLEHTAAYSGMGRAHLRDSLLGRDVGKSLVPTADDLEDVSQVSLLALEPQELDGCQVEIGQMLNRHARQGSPLELSLLP